MPAQSTALAIWAAHGLYIASDVQTHGLMIIQGGNHPPFFETSPTCEACHSKETTQ